ncbi:hypothetical protein V8G54_012556 [Vigna mungo]|uniref:Uncharacterized protein n=1 Tax=Vigna mungo TaxID=3915 RepID=A0AAQ3NSH6_VIGMU
MKDISVAVLRTFISKRKQEHEAMLSKKTKGAPKVPENNEPSELVKEEEPDTTPPEDHKSNGKCKIEEEISPEEPCRSVEEDSVKLLLMLVEETSNSMVQLQFQKLSLILPTLVYI